MMEIKILGTGCAKCHKLEEVVREVVAEIGVDASVQRVEDMKEILNYAVLMTPGLVIDGELVVSGKVPDKAQVTRYIVNALSKK